MFTLYQQQSSGNCYKVRLILAHTGAPFRVAEINSLDGSTRAPEFLKLNPNGKVPLLVWEDGHTLAESNAILLHMAAGGVFFPEDKWRRAKMHEWLFWEQYTHEPAIAVRRSFLVYESRRNMVSPKRMESLLREGENALALMEKRLAESEWLAGGGATAADLSLYAYTHMAEEGGYNLQKYPAVCAWLARVAALPGHVDIHWLP